MDYLFSGRQAKVLNHNYVKSGSRGFYINQRYLIKNGMKIQQKLNLRYYYAYLDTLVYFTYRHLFGLEWKMRKVGNPMYWYNSVSAQRWLGFDRKMMDLGINPVQYLSSCFSSFYYQYAKYHRIYDYRVECLFDSSHLSKYLHHIKDNDRRTNSSAYYFCGTPILDLVFRLSKFRWSAGSSFLKPFLREIRFNWLSYLNENEKLLRMPELQFRMYFRHSRTPLEKKLIESDDWLNIVKLVGIPDDAQAFGFGSNRLWAYTKGYTQHLLGLGEIYRNIVDIPGYKLYSKDVARRELKNIKLFDHI